MAEAPSNNYFIELLKTYRRLGFSVIPLKYGDKRPLVPWKTFQERRPTEEEVEEWLRRYKRFNIGIVCGSISNNLVVIDFDEAEQFKLFVQRVLRHPRLTRILDNTWIVRTGKGYHVYFQLEGGVPRTAPRLVDGVDVKGEGGYVVAPPSKHPSGAEYRFAEINGVRYGPPDIPAPNMLTQEEWRGILRLLGAAGETRKKEGAGKGAGAGKTPRRLGEEQVKRIVSLLEPYYVKGSRDMLVFSLLGLFVKAGVEYDSARRVVELLATNKNDEEIRQRLYLVDYHYGKRINILGLEKLRGVSGLREVLENVLRSQGVSEEDIVRRVSETITELYMILGLPRSPGVAWLVRKGMKIKKWVAVGKQGIYIFTRSGDGEPTIRIVSNAVIEKAKVIRIIGLDLKNLYRVTIGGEEVTGSVDEIVAYIERHYGLERGARYAVARLIEHMAGETEELFYSPGPWVVGDGKIVFAREPGYTPIWKPYVIWNPPSGDIAEDTMRRALEAIKKLVEAYRDPSKPSLVLSYVAVAPIMHHVKKVLNIAPHLIIHGLEGTGKSILLELVKLIYSITWEDSFPGTDFQARKCLAASTLPAIIDEIGGVIEGCRNNRKDSLEALNVLHRAATQHILRVSGGHSYGGYFLAIRTIIGATNADVSLVPWQLDKFILVNLSVREGIDLNKAMGCTPRTMPADVKKAMPHVGVELLRELEQLLPRLEELGKLSRSEIRSRLVAIGYQAWTNLYRRYGLEPFPPPAEPETELEKNSQREQYEDIFQSYVAQCINGAKGFPPIQVWSRKPETDPSALQDLNADLAIAVASNIGANTRILLLCKPAFLTRFMSWASREFGLPPMGWRRLAEILGFTLTRRKIGGKIVNNLLVKEIEI